MKAVAVETGVEALLAIIAEKDAALAQKKVEIAQKDAMIVQQAVVVAQQATALEQLIPYPPSAVWVESNFAEHATLRWTPRATGVVASELIIGAVDEATHHRLDGIGRAASDAIGGSVVDPRLVAGRRLRFFVTAVLKGADSSHFRSSELSTPISIGANDFGRVALNQAAVLREDAAAVEGILTTPRGAAHGKWSSKHHIGAMRVQHVRGLGLLRVPRLAKAAAARSLLLYAARSEVVNTASIMICIMRFATPYCTPTRAERHSVCNACHRSDDTVLLAALLHAGIDPNTVDVNGATPVTLNQSAPLLLIAARQNHTGTVAALLAAGADADNMKSSGCTPLYMAAQEGHLTIVEQLIAAFADVEKATVSVLLFTVTFHASLAHSLTRSP
jgi:hypothetical protein